MQCKQLFNNIFILQKKALYIEFKGGVFLGGNNILLPPRNTPLHLILVIKSH